MSPMLRFHWCLLMILVGCGRSDGGEGQHGGSIGGTATTADGRPVAAFTVVYAGFPLDKLGTYDGNGHLVSPDGGNVQGKDGRYEIKVPDGQYGTSASLVAQWHGRPFQFALEADDGRQSTEDRVEVTAAKGVRRNYVWQLTGPRPGQDMANEGSTWGRATYGACLGLRLGEYEKVAGQVTVPSLHQLRNGTDAERQQVVEVTLTPRGKLIDGSNGRVIVGKVPVVADGTYSGGLRGIPIGDYVATARLLRADGTEVRRLRLALKPGQTSADYQGYHVDWQPSVEVVFDTPYDPPLADWGAQPTAVYIGG